MSKAQIKYVHMGAFPIYVGFTSSPGQYAKEMRRLKVKRPPPFVTPGSSATTHTFEKGSDTTSIVCVSRKAAKGKTRAQIAAMIAHEAVHVKQKLMRAINEDEPSAEFEAYTVQWVTQFMVTKWEAGA